MSPLSAGTPSGLDLCSPGCTATVPVSSFVHLSCYVWKAFFPQCSPSPLALTTFPSPLQQGSLRAEGRGLMKTSHLGLNAPKSSILHIVKLWVLLIILYCNKKVLSCGLNETLIYVFSSILTHDSWFILLLFPFSRLIVVDFSRSPMTSLVPGSWPL